jgi:hypothetical protein
LNAITANQMAAIPSPPAGLPLVDIDWDAFDPWRIQTMSHSLSRHGLLQSEALIRLGQRLQETGQFLTHNNQASPATPFGQAGRLHPNRRSIVDTLTNIREAGAWVLLRNVQADPLHGRLVAHVFDEIEAELRNKDPGVSFRAGWIFVSSPRTVTPFHMDLGQNFLFHIRGTKTIHVWDHDDVAVVSERARDHYHNAQDMLRWEESFRARAHVFTLSPGVGVYIPSTAPHLVETSDDDSVTFTITCNTDSTRRKARLHAVHDVMRSLRITPPAVGQRPLFDRLSLAGASSLLRLQRLMRGATHNAGMVPYAPPD